MCSLNTVRWGIAAFAEKLRKEKWGGIRLVNIIQSLFASLLLLLFSLARLESASYTVNVYLPNAQLQSQFLATTTTYFSTVVTPGYFQGTLTANISGINLNQPSPPQISSGLVTLDTLANKLTLISTYTYVAGEASGMIYERFNDAGQLGYFMNLCNSATTFNLVSIDSTTCQGVLGFVDNWIVFQTSGMAVVPNAPPGM